jgi:hypothetical protein
MLGKSILADGNALVMSRAVIDEVGVAASAIRRRYEE